ncbi:MAG: hypothetical protein PSU93_09455 [Methylobacter sp.]|uniref:Uncharacterized protein n=1 Tax=Candidatus Methylobacter titanis TaxID=3053457 RepID=A0AA43Q6L4_9GAMM|nr:hypothetical protein [Candidatus Methylobacter titanis]
MTTQELRAKAASCRERAARLTGCEQHRELQRAQALECEAGEREYYRTRMAGCKRLTNTKEAAHG